MSIEEPTQANEHIGPGSASPRPRKLGVPGGRCGPSGGRILQPAYLGVPCVEGIGSSLWGEVDIYTLNKIRTYTNPTTLRGV